MRMEKYLTLRNCPFKTRWPPRGPDESMQRSLSHCHINRICRFTAVLEFTDVSEPPE